jgi:hypothetical protein
MLEKTPKKKRSLASQTWNKKTFAMFEENTVFCISLCLLSVWLYNTNYRRIHFSMESIRSTPLSFIVLESSKYEQISWNTVNTYKRFNRWYWIKLHYCSSDLVVQQIKNENTFRNLLLSTVSARCYFFVYSCSCYWPTPDTRLWHHNLCKSTS